MSKALHHTARANNVVQANLVQAKVSRSALEHNLAKIRQCSGQSPIWGVVKANAYGHGVVQVVPAISKFVQGFACARLEEAEEILEIQHGLNPSVDGLSHTECDAKVLPILVLGGCYEPLEYSIAHTRGFQLVVHSEFQINVLEKSGIPSRHQQLQVWLKINIGMNRLGILPTQLVAVLQRLKEIPFVKVVGVLAHLGTADEPNHPETLMQLKTCVDIFSQAKLIDPHMLTSLSNSANLLTPQQEQSLKYPLHGGALDWVRPGICIYGSSPFQGQGQSQSAKSLQLKPVMTLKAKIISIRDIEPGQSVGYGATWQAQVPTRLFAVAIGYGDGYPRHIESATAYINGIILSQAGVISMDCTVFQSPVSQLNQCRSPRVGDFVELWGEHISVDEVAKKSQSIGYERLTQLSRRVHYRLD